MDMQYQPGFSDCKAVSLFQLGESLLLFSPWPASLYLPQSLMLGDWRSHQDGHVFIVNGVAEAAIRERT
jgi:hypothetical protein